MPRTIAAPTTVCIRACCSFIITPVLITPVLITPVLITPVLITPVLITPVLVNPVLITPVLVNPVVIAPVERFGDHLVPTTCGTVRATQITREPARSPVGGSSRLIAQVDDDQSGQHAGRTR
jgi:hypothetical protein